MISFKEMGLCSELVQAIEEIGFSNPMPIQSEAIPELLDNNRDLIALAQTGTGKTAAFGLPVIQQLDTRNKKTEVLVLCPTRELCIQISQDLVNYAKYIKGCTVVSVYGGASIENQRVELKKGAKIVVATPGRLLDLSQRGYLSLENITTVILDEADEMLNMGFKEELDDILKQTPSEKRTLLFSATMSEEVGFIAREYMHDPFEITIGHKNSGSENVSHQYYLVHPNNRYLALKRVVDYYPKIYAIIFCKTKRETQEVASALMKDGYNADALHGDLSQSQREHVMLRFRCKNIQVLVATDVAARGLDVNDLTHVINYNLPNEAEQYNHRSGRTGRAHKKGISISILTPKEISRIKRIEQLLKKKLELVKIPSGKEICEKQLFHMVDEMEQVDVNYSEIENFLPVIHKKLAWLDKEELIRRFVSVEFNRFLDYYRHAGDINAVVNEHRTKGSEKAIAFSDRMVPLKFNLGYKDKVVPQRLIALINEQMSGTKVKIGKIDIRDNESFVSVDGQYADELVSIFENITYRGVPLDVVISTKSNATEKRGSSRNSRSHAFYSEPRRKGNTSRHEHHPRKKGQTQRKRKA